MYKNDPVFVRALIPVAVGRPLHFSLTKTIIIFLLESGKTKRIHEKKNSVIVQLVHELDCLLIAAHTQEEGKQVKVLSGGSSLEP
jgi:hypothetical protein